MAAIGVITGGRAGRGRLLAAGLALLAWLATFVAQSTHHHGDAATHDDCAACVAAAVSGGAAVVGAGGSVPLVTQTATLALPQPWRAGGRTVQRPRARGPPA